MRGPASRSRGALVALIVALLAALAVAEGALRLIGFGDPVLYDNRWAYGYRPLPNQTRRRLWGARVHLNALGLRGPEVAIDRPPDGLRILFLGDSVTWGGTYVDDTQVFSMLAAREVAERLPKKFSRVEGLDAGVNAWGPLNILGLVGSGGAFPAAFDANYWVITALEDDFNRHKTQIGEVPYFNVAPATALQETLVIAGYRLLTHYKRPKPPEDRARIARRNMSAYLALARRARALGAGVLLVWHPYRDALTGAPEPHRRPLLDRAAAAGVPVLDLTTAYAREGGTRLYSDGLHLSVAGHAVAGKAIGERLAELLSR
jgi:hypothetical protein